MFLKNKLDNIKQASFSFSPYKHKITHTCVGTAELTCEDERLTMSSTKVLLRPQTLH